MRIQIRRQKKKWPSRRSLCPLRLLPGGQHHFRQQQTQGYVLAASVVALVVHEYARTFSLSQDAGVGRSLSLAGSVKDPRGGEL